GGGGRAPAAAGAALPAGPGGGAPVPRVSARVCARPALARAAAVSRVLRRRHGARLRGDAPDGVDRADRDVPRGAAGTRVAGAVKGVGVTACAPFPRRGPERGLDAPRAAS